MGIPTYIINLESRTERKADVLTQFQNRDEFNVTVVAAVKHTVGAIGLWESLKGIVQNSINRNDEFILVCEDDHQFTGHYSKEILFNCIKEAKSRGADILCGGVSWFNNAIPVTDYLYWVEKFSGLQFTVIFHSFYQKILNADFDEHDAADYKISGLTDRKFFIAPFISIQKDYGYSDVTVKNNATGRVATLFDKCTERIIALKKVTAYYAGINVQIIESEMIDIDHITIPTYIINLPERTDRKAHLEKQFANKPEFGLTIIEAIKEDVGAVGLWLTFRKIAQIAIDNDDDVIIVCEDDHEFTKHYSKEYLIKNIVDAAGQGVEVLCGGIGGFETCIRTAESRYWINWFFCTQFIILYKPVFQKILDEEFDSSVTADGVLSEITSNKMTLFPFISVQKDFGYSDVTSKNNDANGHIDSLFKNTAARLNLYKNNYDQFTK